MVEKYKEGWLQFIHFCRETEDAKSLTTLFDLLLTQEERENLAMRCLIIQELLKKEKTQRDMAKHLKVSISKITRGSNEIKRMKDAFIDHLKSKLLK